MNAEQMWREYCERESVDAGYDAWSFGGDPDLLAQLVLSGIKTATASAYALYELEGEELPKAGEYSVILDSREEAVCVIETTRVFTVPFQEVDEVQAFREGEGDRSLAYWRSVHERFFRGCMEEAGLAFDPGMMVVFEEFKKVYP